MRGSSPQRTLSLTIQTIFSITFTFLTTYISHEGIQSATPRPFEGFQNNPYAPRCTDSEGPLQIIDFKPQRRILHSIWLYPHGNDKSAKRLVDCANKILHGEPKEDSVHLWKREALQKYCAGLEFSKTPQVSRCSMTSSMMSAISEVVYFSYSKRRR